MVRKKAGLGERHRKILHFLNKFNDDNGYSPSIRQIGEAINVNSTSLVDYYLRQLEEMGYIERDHHVSRSIRILKPSTTSKAGQAIQNATRTVSDLLTVPLYGKIFAGSPIPVPSSDLSYFDPESSVEIARSMLPARESTKELYALEVEGDSMIDAMINDGDIIIMKPSQEANNGEMVAVWLDDNDETTLKYFYKEKGRIRLQPANPTMGPIYINEERHLRIMGKVVMVIRQIRSIAA